jgi:hypothetical protein
MRGTTCFNQAGAEYERAGKRVLMWMAAVAAAVIVVAIKRVVG